MLTVDRKEIDKVKQFFGCSSLDAIYYLMPNECIDEGSVSDVAIVDPLPAAAAEAQHGTIIAVHNQPV